MVSGLVKAFDLVLMAVSTCFITDIILSEACLWGRVGWGCVRTIALARNFRGKKESHDRERFNFAVIPTAEVRTDS